MTDQIISPVTPEQPETLFSSNETVAPQSQEKELTLSQEDIQKMLKQNANAQEMIKTLKEENAQYRGQLTDLQKDLENSRSFDDLISAMGTQDITTSLPESTAPQLDPKELLSQLKEEIFNDLTQAQVRSAQEANIQESLKAVKERFGDNYEQRLTELGSELGLSNEYMDQLAATSPKAFMQLVGGNKKVSDTQPEISSFRTTPNNSESTYDYASIAKQKGFDTPEARQANHLWNSPDFQERMRLDILKRASEKGSQFGNQI